MAQLSWVRNHLMLLSLDCGNGMLTTFNDLPGGKRLVLGGGGGGGGGGVSPLKSLQKGSNM